MKTIEIKNKYNDDIIIAGKYESIKDCLEKTREADLREADLHRADLGGADLREAELREADLREADLWGADLRGADLREANLWGADLWEADLRGADLRGAKYRDCKLTISPIQIFGDKYNIMVIGDYIKIGCEEHKKAEWFKFTQKEIIAMGGKDALVWWKKWKPILKQNCDSREEQ